MDVEGKVGVKMCENSGRWLKKAEAGVSRA
nr:MAG TPA: hypothetical protein [Caudoviricetes sp.]